MKSEGIDGILFETHNWGSAVAFWQGLGYALEFETGHNSGRLRHPRGGAYIFIAERPKSHTLQTMIAFAAPPTRRSSRRHARAPSCSPSKSNIGPPCK